jgi:hypothetical protein
MQRRRKCGLEHEGLTIRIHSLCTAPQIAQHIAPVSPGLCKTGLQLQGPIMGLQSLGWPIESTQDQRQVRVRRCIPRVDLQCPGDIAQRSVQPPLLELDNAPHVQCMKVFWSKLQKHVVGALGFGQLPALMQRHSLAQALFKIQLRLHNDSLPDIAWLCQ